MASVAQGEYSVLVGGIAFLFTVAHVLSVFPIYFLMTIQRRVPGKIWLLTSLSTGAVAHSLWLVYAWPCDDLFVKMAIALWVVAYLVFIAQSAFISKINN